MDNYSCCSLVHYNKKKPPSQKKVFIFFGFSECGGTAGFSHSLHGQLKTGHLNATQVGFLLAEVRPSKVQCSGSQTVGELYPLLNLSRGGALAVMQSLGLCPCEGSRGYFQPLQGSCWSLGDARNPGEPCRSLAKLPMARKEFLLAMGKVEVRS